MTNWRSGAGRAIGGLLVALIIALGASTTGLAQKKAAPAGVPAEQRTELRRLVETLKDDAKRKELIATLERLLAAQRLERKPPTASSFLERVVARFKRFADGLPKAADLVPNLSQMWTWVRDRATDARFRAELLAGLWKGALILFAGLAAAWVMRRLIRRMIGRRKQKPDRKLLQRAGIVLFRALVDLLPIAAFAGVALVVLPLTQPSAVTSAIALTLITAVVVARSLMLIARAVVVPQDATLRLTPLNDEEAAFLYIWLKRLTYVAVFGYFGLVALDALYLPVETFQAALKVLGLILAVMLVMFILQIRQGVGAWFAGRAEAPRWRGFGRRIGAVWHLFAILYVVAAFVVWSLGFGGGFVFLIQATLLTVMTVIVARVILFGIGFGLDRIFAVENEFATRHPGLSERATRYLPTVKAIVAGAVWLFALLALLQIWGVDVASVFASDAGGLVLSTGVSILIVVIAAFIVWALIKNAIARYIDRLSQRRADGQRVARIRTLLPMIEKAILFALVIVTALIVMAELGIDIGPMIAGAGVIGLAIGFGAQTLVKDIINGVFTVMEDSMAVGDTVTVANRTGTVQDLSIRSVILRDYHGTQHTIPFSAISDVQNLSKDFSFAVMDVGVSYRENVDTVMALIVNVAAEFRADESASANVLEDLEVAGIHELADSAVVLRSRFKTRPGTQFAVRREMYRRIKTAFDEAGVEIPYPHRTLYFGEDRNGEAPPARVEIQGQAGPAKAGEPAAGEPAAGAKDTETKETARADDRPKSPAANAALSPV